MKTMKKTLLIVFFGAIGLSCNNRPQKTNEVDNSTIMEDNIKIDDKKSIRVEHANWNFENSIDTVVYIDGEPIFQKIEIRNVPGKFVELDGFDDGGRRILKTPDTEIHVLIGDSQYKLRKQDIPDLLEAFVETSLFHRIRFYSITEEASVFEIVFGIPESGGIAWVFLTIDSDGNKWIRTEVAAEPEGNVPLAAFFQQKQKLYRETTNYNILFFRNGRYFRSFLYLCTPETV